MSGYPRLLDPGYCFAAAGDWLGDNCEYVFGGVAAVGGAVLMFVPGGQVAGMALMSFGAGVVIQKVTTGEVNWAQSAALGVTGAIGGAGFAAARAAMATSSSAGRLGGYIAINAGINGSWRGVAGAMLGGGVSGAIGGLAGPAGGTLAKAGGHSAYTSASGTARQATPAFWAQTGAGGSVVGMVTDKAVTGGRSLQQTWAGRRRPAVS